jgi:RND family efflux transporter MFP subunit
MSLRPVASDQPFQRVQLQQQLLHSMKYRVRAVQLDECLLGAPVPLVRAMESGGVLFVNELNRMPEGVQNVMLPAMDEGRIEVPMLGTVQARDGFVVVATQNPAEFVATSHLAEALLARAGAGQAQTERSFATIAAPYSGVVSARHVEVGEMATPGKPLMTGFDPGTLRVTATVPQAQVTAIQSGARARIEVPSTGKWVDATQLTVIPQADPRTHTTQVRLGLPADVRGIYPGIYARAHFVTGRASALLVPRAAVLQRSEVTAVYVLPDSGPPRLRQIRLGSAGDEHSVEVLAGLRTGERVALEPVKAGMRD